MNSSIIWYPLLFRTTPIFSKKRRLKPGSICAIGVAVPLNDRVLGSNIAAIFLSNDQIIHSVYLLLRMNVTLDFTCVESVDLRGSRIAKKKNHPKTNKQTKWKEKFLPTVGLEAKTIRFVVRASTDWASRAWWKLSFLVNLIQCY